MNIIVAIAEDGAIGRAGDLLCYLPNDLKHFKELTTGATVVMGKTTFFSLPRRPLPNRRNIVLTRDESFCHEGTEVAHSMEEMQQMVAGDKKIFIIGGGQVYQQLIEYVDRLYITLIHHKFENADTFFPSIDEHKWQRVSEEHNPADERHAYAYTYIEYKRR